MCWWGGWFGGGVGGAGDGGAVITHLTKVGILRARRPIGIPRVHVDYIPAAAAVLGRGGGGVLGGGRGGGNVHVPHPLVVSPFAVFVQAVVGVGECQGYQEFGVVVVLADVFVVSTMYRLEEL